MYDFSRSLGNTVKKARAHMEMSQKEVADAVGFDDRTILNIENGKGNPKMKILYPLIRFLKIDPWEVFYPEMKQEQLAQWKLRMLLSDCSEEEAAELLTIVQPVLRLLRKQNSGMVHK